MVITQALIRSDTHDSETEWFLTNDSIVSTISDEDMSNIVSGIFPNDDITPYVLISTYLNELIFFG